MSSYCLNIFCNLEGFHGVGDRPNDSKARIGIIANNKEYECGSCDSRIDFSSGGTLITLTRAALM